MRKFRNQGFPYGTTRDPGQRDPGQRGATVLYDCRGGIVVVVVVVVRKFCICCSVQPGAFCGEGVLGQDFCCTLLQLSCAEGVVGGGIPLHLCERREPASRPAT